MKTKTAVSIVHALRKIVAFFNRHGHRVCRVVTDAERNFGAIVDPMSSFNIQITHAIPGEHNHRVEQKFCTMRDTARTIVSGLSYVLPEKLTAELLSTAVTAISIRPSYDTGGRSQLEHVTKRKIDINTVALYPFGHVCQIKTIPRPSDAPTLPRTDYGITLGFKIETPQAVKAYIVDSGTVVVRKR